MKAGVAGVKGVEAGSGRVGRGARKFGVGVRKAGIHTEIADLTGGHLRRGWSRTRGGRLTSTPENLPYADVGCELQCDHFCLRLLL